MKQRSIFISTTVVVVVAQIAESGGNLDGDTMHTPSAMTGWITTIPERDHTRVLRAPPMEISLNATHEGSTASSVHKDI